MYLKFRQEPTNWATLNLFDIKNGCEKKLLNLNKEEYILHISNSMFEDKNLFSLFLALIKIKTNFENKKIHIVYDFFLTQNNITYFKILLEKFNIKNIEQKTSKSLFEQISFKEFFSQYLKKEKLYFENNNSFLEKTKICLYKLESHILNSKHILLPNSKHLKNNNDVFIFKKNIKFQLKQDVLLNNINDPTLLFGLIMSLSDVEMKKVFYNILDKDYKKIEPQLNENPFYQKKMLSKKILEVLFENQEVGNNALLKFEQRAQKIYDNCNSILVKKTKADALFNLLYSSNMFKSKSELNRLFNQNAVRTFDNITLSPNQTINNDTKVRVGKKLFFSLEFSNER